MICLIHSFSQQVLNTNTWDSSFSVVENDYNNRSQTFSLPNQCKTFPIKQSAQSIWGDVFFYPYLLPLLCLFRLVHLCIFLICWHSIFLLFRLIYQRIIRLDCWNRDLQTLSSFSADGMISILRFIRISAATTKNYNEQLLSFSML